MAIPFPTTYYITHGTGMSNAGVLTTELSGGSTYARLACNFTGTALSGLTQTLGPWTAATLPATGKVLYSAIFDAITGGNMIAWWERPSPIATTTAVPSVTININFNAYVAQALNLSLAGGAGSSGAMIDQGAQIGTAQGQPLIAGTRLSFQSGALVAQLPTSRIIEGPSRIDFNVGGVRVGHIDSSGNLVMLGTLSAANATVNTGDTV